MEENALMFIVAYGKFMFAAILPSVEERFGPRPAVWIRFLELPFQNSCKFESNTVVL